MDCGHRSGTFLQQPVHWEYNDEQEHRSRIPGMIPDSPGDPSQQHENHGRPMPGALRPEAKPYQLSTGAMFFSRGEQTDSTEQAPTHFEIPTIIVTPPKARSPFAP
jgi:hypothetical protein